MGARVYTQPFPPPTLPVLLLLLLQAGSVIPAPRGIWKTLPLLQLMNEPALPHPSRGLHTRRCL